MSNKELLAKVAETVGVSQKTAGAMIAAMVEMTIDEVREQDSTQFLDMGVLEVKTKEQRTMFNPSTGEKMLIPPKRVLGFRQNTSIKNQIN